MPVEFTRRLSPALQRLADAREAEKTAAAEVDRLKAELKEAKAAWEVTVEEVASAADALIDTEREPTLFDGLGDDPPAPPVPPPRTVVSEPATPDPAADPVRWPAEAEARALPASPAWRALRVADELDGPGHVFDALGVFGVETLGQLADALLAGRTFNLLLLDVEWLREQIELVSADDPHPVRFADPDDEVTAGSLFGTGGGDDPADAAPDAGSSGPADDAPAGKPAKKGKGTRRGKVGRPA